MGKRIALGFGILIILAFLLSANSIESKKEIINYHTQPGFQDKTDLESEDWIQEILSRDIDKDIIEEFDRIKNEKILDFPFVKRTDSGNLVSGDLDNVVHYPDYVPGEILLKLKEGSVLERAGENSWIWSRERNKYEKEFEELNLKYNVKKMDKAFTYTYSNKKNIGSFAKGNVLNEDRYGLSRIYRLVLYDDADILGAVKEYEKLPIVEYAQPNNIYTTFYTPNDPSFSSQWAHQLMQTGNAWDIERGNRSIVIAIIDTGVDWDHPDLASNIWNNTDEDCNITTDLDGNGIYGDCRGYDFVDSATGCIDSDCDTEDNDPMDDHGHGTHCSGIAAAVTNNNVGVSGVCPNCTIMALRAGYKHILGGNLRELDVAQALVYAANNNASIASMSFGGDHDQVMQDAIDTAYSGGVVLIAATGNDNRDYISGSYPAGYDNVISVSSTKNDDGKSSFSNYGEWVDISAPGGQGSSASNAILSTVFNDKYVSWQGTSMACPHVAGIAGLILSRNPDFTPEEVRSVLKSSTDPIVTDLPMGAGRANAYKSMQIDSVPNATILYPGTDDVLSGLIVINGTAKGSSLENYTLYYGVGRYPNSWFPISVAFSNVTNGDLATWNTFNVVDDLYTIKLVSNNHNGWSEDRVFIRVINNGSYCFSCDDCNYKLENLITSNTLKLSENISSIDDCISIERNDTIFNCMGNKISGNGGSDGISISSYNNVSVRNCVIENFKRGIIANSGYTNLTNNIFNDNEYGFLIGLATSLEQYIDSTNIVNGEKVHYFYNVSNFEINIGENSGHLQVAFSDNVTIRENNVFGDGVILSSVTNSTIANNIITDAQNGIFIHGDSVFNNISGNAINKDDNKKYGIYFNDISQVKNYIDQFNTVNSEPILHYFNTNGTIDNPLKPAPLVMNVANTTNLAKVFIAQSRYINISGFSLTNNLYGIYSRYSNNIFISSNDINDNYVGNLLYYTNNSNVVNNEINYNSLTGNFLHYSMNNSIHNNNVSGTKNCSFDYLFFGIIPLTLSYGGIGIFGAENNISENFLNDNNCGAISFMGGLNNELRENFILTGSNNYGIYFDLLMGRTNNYINQSNTVNGETVYYYNNVHGENGHLINITDITLSNERVSNLGKINIINCSHINISNVFITGNDYGILIDKSSNISIKNSNISGIIALNSFGDSTALEVSRNTINASIGNLTESTFADRSFSVNLYDISDIKFWENNMLSDVKGHVSSNNAKELSYSKSGNFWGHTRPPYFIPGNDSNDANVKDSYAYGMYDGWLDETIPQLNYIPPTDGNGSVLNHNWLFVNVSSSKNLTVCFLNWFNTTENISMTVARHDDKTYCYKNITNLEGGWYEFNVYANDSVYNWNNTGILKIKVNGPPVISDALINRHLVYRNEELNISATVTDSDNVSSVYFLIENESYEYREEIIGNVTYKVPYIVDLGNGLYNLSIYANDTYTSSRTSCIDNFTVSDKRDIIIEMGNYQGNATNTSFYVANPRDGYIPHSGNDSVINFSFASGYWDINFSDGHAYSILMEDSNFTFNFYGYMHIDNVPSYLVSPPAHNKFVNIISALTNLSYDTVNVTLNYSGLISNENRLVVYKCASWNFSGRSCLGGENRWGNELTQNTDYDHDSVNDLIIIQSSGFSAFAVGEEVPFCGNGMVDDPAEDCDGGDKNGETCVSLGYDTGSLSCTENCAFNTGSCRNTAGTITPTKRIYLSSIPAKVTIPQGGNSTVNISANSNYANNLTNVALNVASGCTNCVYSVTPVKQNISPGNSGYFLVNIRATNSQNIGIYPIYFNVSSDEDYTDRKSSILNVTPAELMCQPGELKCSVTGNILKCASNGRSWVANKTCSKGCRNKECITGCIPGELRCSGPILRKCLSDGSGWVDEEDCENGCDSARKKCKDPAITLPDNGSLRCFNENLEMFLNNEWVIIENCTGGCFNKTCVAPGPVEWDFSPMFILLPLLLFASIGGLGYYYIRANMTGPDWEDIERKWENIETNTREIEGNLSYFLNKKVKIVGQITESMQNETGVMTSTIADSNGEMLILSNPPAPSGIIEVLGYVGQNEFGEIYIEIESFKRKWTGYITQFLRKLQKR